MPEKIPGNRPGMFTGFLAFSGSSPQIGPSRPAHNSRKCPTLGRVFSLARLIPAVPAKIQNIWPIAGYLRWHDGNKLCQRKYPADCREFSADMSWPRRADLPGKSQRKPASQNDIIIVKHMVLATFWVCSEISGWHGVNRPYQRTYPADCRVFSLARRS